MANTVTVTGFGTAAAVPDVLHVRLSADGTGPDVATALDAASDALASVLAALDAARVDPQDRGTASLSVEERWGREGERLGMVCSQSLQIVLRDVPRSGEILRAIAGAGGNALRIGSVSLAISDPAPLLVRAREAAFADARARAERFAELAGRPLGAVDTILEGSGAPDSGRWEVQAAAAQSFGRSVPIESGQQTVRAAVTVTWNLLG